MSIVARLEVGGVSRLRLRWAAGLAAASLLGSACIARGEVDQPSPTASPSDSPSPSPSATPDAPLLGYAALASDPAAVIVATVRGRSEDSPVLVVQAVPSPADREILRNLDQLVVLASDDRDRSRLAASAGQSVEAVQSEVADVESALAAFAAERLRSEDPPGRVHLAGTVQTEALLEFASSVGPGEVLLATDGDPRAPGPGNDALRALAADITVVGLGDAGAPDQAWKLDVVRAGVEVPGGGQLLEGRRYIAAYGTPGTPSLGVLGEQGVEAAHQRVLQIAEPYDDGTLPIVPVFEIIAAVASASATEDGDYSYGISFELIREWVDYAAANDILVILDIQPGRTDFLTHAKQYEEFLVQPHVGLALDPEWRLKDNQVHLRQIGTVDGAEINQVVDWLAALVREHDLPQKMLIMHQFKLSMITNRDLVTSPDELYVVLHMDGQGGQPAKDSTYETLISEGQPWAPGWKNFYDEDQPMAGAEKVLAVTPQPVFISFQ